MPDWVSVPDPLMALATVAESLRLKINDALLVMAPEPRAPVAPPSPTCKTPPLTVVTPVYVLVPVRICVPVPVLVSLAACPLLFWITPENVPDPLLMPTVNP